jgi:DNA-binding MarR family transcriptional regulator
MKRLEPSNDLPSQFALVIFRLNGLLMRNGERITQPLGQSSARWQVLGRVGFMAQTVAQRARDMGQARQSVLRVADVLKDDGLVAYQENPSDHRTKLVELTPQGRKVLNGIYRRNEEWSKRIQTKLDPSKLQAVIEELERLSDVLEEDSL